MSFNRRGDALSAPKMKCYEQAAEPGFYSTHRYRGETKLRKFPPAFCVYSLENSGDKMKIVFSTPLGDYCLIVPKDHPDIKPLKPRENR